MHRFHPLCKKKGTVFRGNAPGASAWGKCPRTLWFGGLHLTCKDLSSWGGRGCGMSEQLGAFLRSWGALRDFCTCPHISSGLWGLCRGWDTHAQSPDLHLNCRPLGCPDLIPPGYLSGKLPVRKRPEWFVAKTD